MTYSIDHIKNSLQRKGYRFFENGDYNVNIVGIRNSLTKNKVTNKFDDLITVSYKVNGKWQYHEFDCTTDPGTHWVENTISEDGVAILKEGQYSGSHKIRKHQGRYEALGQCKPVTVYRDDNRATKHAGKKSTQIDKWSAGCQVIASNDDWTKFMKIMRKARDTWSNSFTYTLIQSKDIQTTWL